MAVGPRRVLRSGENGATFVELELGPADNMVPMPLCWACEGIDFLLVCFDLVSTNHSVVKVRDTRDVIADMFRIPMYQIWVEQESVVRTKEREEERICWMIQNHFITDLDDDGRSILEKRLWAPRESLFVKDSEVVVSKQGKVIAPILNVSMLTAKDIADVVMRLITLSAVSLVLFATASGLIIHFCQI